MSDAPDPLFRLVEAFFRDHLQRVRGASRHTIRAYADALRLFLSFVADETGRQVAHLRLNDLTVERVLAFLDHLESGRRNGIATRNARLTAIRSLFRHLVRHDPVHAGQYQRVLTLPSKRTPQRVVSYLEPEEAQALLRQPDRRTAAGLRDHALLLFLYNTGARIGEALDVRLDDLQLVRPYQVHLRGKGRKDRICPLWSDTVTALRSVLERASGGPKDQVFRSQRDQPLSRDGADYILAKHLLLATKELPHLRRKHVTPHVLRHSCAVALLQAGVEVTVIRDYLGHESVATTGRYTRVNLQMKRRVLDAFWKRAALERVPDPRWQPKADLLAFLSSL